MDKFKPPLMSRSRSEWLVRLTLNHTSEPAFTSVCSASITTVKGCLPTRPWASVGIADVKHSSRKESLFIFALLNDNCYWQSLPSQSKLDNMRYRCRL